MYATAAQQVLVVGGPRTTYHHKRLATVNPDAPLPLTNTPFGAIARPPRWSDGLPMCAASRCGGRLPKGTAARREYGRGT